MIYSSSALIENEFRQSAQALLEWDNEGGAIVPLLTSGNMTDTSNLVEHFMTEQTP